MPISNGTSDNLGAARRHRYVEKSGGISPIKHAQARVQKERKKEEDTTTTMKTSSDELAGLKDYVCRELKWRLAVELV